MLNNKIYKHYLYPGIILLIILFAEGIRFRLLEIPLERDEGEFAYMGQLILQGIPPYLMCYNMKLPGIYIAYAIIMTIFGQTTTGIHLGFILINSATIIMLFILTKYLFDEFTGIIAVASFSILSLSSSVLGTAAHASHFVIFFAILGIYIILRAMDSGKLNGFFYGGMLLGFAFLIKQPGIFFAIFIFIYFVFISFKEKNNSFHYIIKQIFLFSGGFLLPLLVTCLVFYSIGNWEKFWYWTFVYAYKYGTKNSLFDGLIIFKKVIPLVIGNFYLLIFLSFCGLILSIFNIKIKKNLLFLFFFFLFSFCALSSGFYYRNHYFVFILPSISFFIAICINFIKNLRIKRSLLLSIFIFLIAFFHGIFLERKFFFEQKPVEACRLMYSSNPFPESIEVAKYIKNNTDKSDRILVLGSEPQIYFYSQRISATGYIYMYGLGQQIETTSLQENMIKEINQQKPLYIIYVNIPTSWNEDNTIILKWFYNYVKNFELVGIVDIISNEYTVYRWNNDIKNYSPLSNYVIYIFKRKLNP